MIWLNLATFALAAFALYRRVWSSLVRSAAQLPWMLILTLEGRWFGLFGLGFFAAATIYEANIALHKEETRLLRLKEERRGRPRMEP